MRLRVPVAFALLAVHLHVAHAVQSQFGALKGRTLRGCTLLESPYIVTDSTRPWGLSGVAITYLERLQGNLGFSIQLEAWNDTWSRFIDIMAVCGGAGAPECPCDIGVGSFTMTNERADKISFVWPLSNEAHHMVSRKSDLRVDDSQNTWFVFKTFSPRVWGIIILGIFMHAVGTVFFGPFRPPGSDDTRGMDPASPVSPRSARISSILWQIKRFPAAMLFSYAHLIGHPFGERGQGTPSFHRTAWLVLGVTTGLFLLTVYEASLTVLLFESTKTSPFRTLKDITECALNPEKVAIIKGGASQDFWNSAVNTTENRKKCKRWRKVGMTVDTLEDGFVAVKEGRADYFYSLEGSVLFRAHRNCEAFEPVGEPFFSTSVAFVMANEANVDKNLLQILSRETRILREQDGYPSASLLAARTSCDAVVDATITGGKLWAFFVLYAVSWFLLLLYRCVFLWRRKRGPNKPGHDPQNPDNIVVMDMHSIPTRGITGVTSTDDTFDPFDEYPRPQFPIPRS